MLIHLRADKPMGGFPMTRPFPWKCRTCGEKKLNPVTVDYSTEMEHDGRLYSLTVPRLDILRCEACGTQVLPDAAHEKLLAELRRKASLLTPSQIAAKRLALKLSQKDFASLLG